MRWFLVFASCALALGACSDEQRSQGGAGGLASNGGRFASNGGGSSVNGGSAGTNTGGATGVDGSYQCLGTLGGDSCTGPLGEGSRYRLTLSGANVSLSFEGVSLPDLTPEFGCIGQWSGERFDCSTKLNWVRQGRTCSADLHLTEDSPSQLTFWTGSADMSRVFSKSTCTR